MERYTLTSLLGACDVGEYTTITSKYEKTYNIPVRKNLLTEYKNTHEKREQLYWCYIWIDKHERLGTMCILHNITNYTSVPMRDLNEDITWCLRDRGYKVEYKRTTLENTLSLQISK